MKLFKSSPKSIKGARIINLPPNETKHIIYLVDRQPIPSKKKTGLLDLFGTLSSDSNKSPFVLENICKIIRQIENIPNDESINFFIHTLGGSIMSCELLARAIINHKGTTRAFIPQYAFSAGTYITLSTDEIYMTKNAVLGPVDVQVFALPINSIMDSLKNNTDKRGFISDFLQSHVSKVKQDDDKVFQKIIEAKFGKNYDPKIMELFNQDHHHGYQIDLVELVKNGLSVNQIDIKWRDEGKFIKNCDLITLKVSDDVVLESVSQSIDVIDNQGDIIII